ncbi:MULTISPECIES: GNAT family N-acetyltransferase [Acinetobacter]|jgi:ribosomal protein S18 acetylase RimI-like enzyme|uniref:Acetyltransferase n=6 Tax=Acinetobacter TaxID=469 RepID=A0AA36KB23_ACINO|nr:MULTISPECIES: GNAT family N-acetyltransferase [Acinetobacter]KCX92931.1 acetyltransferase family protein [Acinetobacter baumannii 6112]MDQ9823794.1 GNAT family N-acetyltransferase [Acinetobacter sp. 163]SSR40838.1 acetyltransferase [Acinetobacter baumannii]AZC02505.1 GNAT family N-acetyltransferase [Acinetobacter nosocomialis]AZC04437.1 GNAT family N-acetyltransferase [Acinetobacter nosocomialis]
MKNIEILEINEIGDYEEGLSLLLEDSINSGASIGFLAPVEKDDVLNYWGEVNHKLAQGSSRLWIAIQQGKIVGSVQLSLVSKKNGVHRAEVEKLMVLTSTRKQGIATLLMNELENFAREKGLRLLVLDTREGDVSELLYSKIGFVRVGVIPSFALSSNGNYDGTAIYYKQLV